MGSLTLGAAFGAGLLSFASPCVLPMLPTFLLLLAGSSQGEGRGRRRLLGNTLAFLAGFTLVFLAMGATATVLGQLVLRYWKVLEKAAGVILILLGLFLSGLWTPLFLLRDRRPFLQQKKRGGTGFFLFGCVLHPGLDSLYRSYPDCYPHGRRQPADCPAGNLFAAGLCPGLLHPFPLDSSFLAENRLCPAQRICLAATDPESCRPFPDSLRCPDAQRHDAPGHGLPGRVGRRGRGCSMGSSLFLNILDFQTSIFLSICYNGYRKDC